MRRFVPAALAACLFHVTMTATSSAEPVPAAVESTLSTASRQIRQFAFDGDADTFFASKEGPTAADSFTIVFDRPVALKTVAVVTGRPDGKDRLDAGVLEISSDGKNFSELAKFAGGETRGDAKGKEALAVRITPTADHAHPLAVREVTIDSDPAVAVFKYPVEFVIDVSDAPTMKGWAEEVARLCEHWYPRLNEELRSDGFKPSHVVTMTLSSSYRGVAEAQPSAGKILGSARYFKAHPDDVGAMIHETTHVVQRYRGRSNPGWLVEGLCDYIRFFKFEPGKLGRVDPVRARYNDAYRTTAAFLAYVTDTYDEDLVPKLNTLMREGHYREEAFKDLTGKTVQELDEEWRATLKR